MIGVRHTKWDERPLLVLVLKPGVSATREEIFAFMQGKIASWWMPDEIVFVDEIPHTATGKISEDRAAGAFQEFRSAGGRDGALTPNSRHRAR